MNSRQGLEERDLEAAEAGEPWLNRNVVGMGVSSLLSDWGHEMATAVLPLFIVTIGASAAALGVIEGASDGASTYTKLAGGRLADRGSAACRCDFRLSDNWIGDGFICTCSEMVRIAGRPNGGMDGARHTWTLPRQHAGRISSGREGRYCIRIPSLVRYARGDHWSAGRDVPAVSDRFPRHLRTEPRAGSVVCGLILFPGP